MVNNGGAITDDVGGHSYQERKETGRCTYPGCPDPACEDAGMCQPHRDRARSRQQKWRQKRARLAKQLLATRKAKAQCLRCGAKRVSGEDHCAKCLVVVGDLAARTQGVCIKIRDNHAQIEAATKIDAGGRSRYVGQGKRGRQSVASIDTKDFDYAEDALRKMRAGFAFAAGTDLSRLEKRDAGSAANAFGDLAIRFVEDIQARHGHFVDPAGRKGGD